MPAANLTSLPTALSLATAGQVNSDTFYGAAPGTMYYEGMSDRKTLGYGFGNLWTVTFSFAWRSIPWNKLFHKTSSGGQFEGVALIGSSGSGSGSSYDGITGPFYTATPFAPFLSLT